MFLFLFWILFTFHHRHCVAVESEEFNFPNWKKQIEEILQQNHKWKLIMESAMAQFALAQFPENFTPETFSKGVNKTIVINQQKTTLRSLIYHRSVSTMDDQLYIPLPDGVTVDAARAVVEELGRRGFTAFWIESAKRVFLSKTKIK